MRSIRDRWGIVYTAHARPVLATWQSLDHGWMRDNDVAILATRNEARLLARETKARTLTQHDNSPSVPVLRTVLPGEQEGRYAADGLRQRWFGSLRWYGYSQDMKGVTLSWTTEDGGIRLDARFEGILLSVDARLADQSRISEAIVAAHRLLYEITQTYIAAGQRALPPPNS